MTNNYSSRKLERKQHRCEAIIRADVGIDRSEAPTRFVAILNAGLSTGLTEEAVLSVAVQHGAVQQVLMLPNKSYCFMECATLNDAEEIYKGMHGRAELEQRGGVVYLSYFKQLPACEDANVWSKSMPEGLVLLPDFITEAEEESLLKAIAVADDEEKRDLKHRRVKHFGYEFLYGKNNVDPTKPLNDKIPEACDILWPRLKEEVTKLGIPAWHWDAPDQLTVNIYEPGQGIPPHVDTHSAFLDPIFSLSLLGDVVMDFRRGLERQPVKLQRLSMLVMSGASRYDWTHGITPRNLDVVPSSTGLTVMARKRRISLTFRRLRRGPCDCTFTTLCDTRLNSQSSTESNISELVAVRLEELNVHSVYECIAPHFSETRHTPWPRVADFLRSFPIGSVLLDVGCGNGKYLQCNVGALTIGCDRSGGLLSACLERAKDTKKETHNWLPNAFRCDCLQVPVRSQSIDGCISIAVIHHLATPERRLAAVREMARLLRADGRALIYVWAKNQRANDKKSAYLLQNKALNKNKITIEQQRQRVAEELQLQQQEQHLKGLLPDAPQLPVHTNRTDFIQQDILVPWKLKTTSENNNEGQNGVHAPPNTYLRYYHVFEGGELEAMLANVPEIELLQSYYDQGNHCVIFAKR